MGFLRFFSAILIFECDFKRDDIGDVACLKFGGARVGQTDLQDSSKSLRIIAKSRLIWEKHNFF